MGYYWMMAFCINCRKPISFNPHSVPSLVVNGKREPLCRICAEKWNTLHPLDARPIRDDAYEPVNEEDFRNE